jgi:hypothetical protein
MRRVAPYPRRPNLLRCGLWGGLIAVLLVSSPYLLDILIRGIGWIIRTFPSFDKLREVPLWLHR